MSISRFHSEKLNFVLTTLSGTVDDVALFDHVRCLNEELKGRVETRELADCRTATDLQLSTRGSTFSAGHEELKLGSKLAILVSKTDDYAYAMARAYQMFSEKSRDSVMVFRDFDKALAWLSANDPQEQDALRQFISIATGECMPEI